MRHLPRKEEKKNCLENTENDAREQQSESSKRLHRSSEEYDGIKNETKQKRDVQIQYSSVFVWFRCLYASEWSSEIVAETPMATTDIHNGTHAQTHTKVAIETTTDEHIDVHIILIRNFIRKLQSVKDKEPNYHATKQQNVSMGLFFFGYTHRAIISEMCYTTFIQICIHNKP